MSAEKKNIAILGSTGSIGVQALEVIREQKEHLQAEVLTAGSNSQMLIEQAREFIPNAVVIADKSKYAEVRDALEDLPIKVYAGEEAICQVVEMDSLHVVLTAMVGFSGLKPTLHAIRSGKNIALANKETLVVAGELVTREAREKGVNIYPVDSEHSAIFQCLAGEFHNKIEKVILTASGGPFRGFRKEDLEKVTLKEALNHPNWSMGAKITIDSATMMNKGLEVIEARWLFGLKPEQIDVVIHPQSIIHSMVQFEDGSIKAQMGLPDMKLPIQYALCYPNRLKNNFKRFSFADYTDLTFEKPDTSVFPSLSLAYSALQGGGNLPCILNAANEEVVGAFLSEKIEFSRIPDIIEKCMGKVSFIPNPAFNDYTETDKVSRQIARELI